MLYLTLANVFCDSSAPSFGKSVSAVFHFPPKRETDGEEDYRMCCRILYQQWWRNILEVLELWEPGFLLRLPGKDALMTFQPRLGPLLGDLLEARLMAAVLGSFAVRCPTQVQAEPVVDPGAAAAQAHAAEGDDDATRALGGEDHDQGYGGADVDGIDGGAGEAAVVDDTVSESTDASSDDFSLTEVSDSKPYISVGLGYYVSFWLNTQLLQD